MSSTAGLPNLPRTNIGPLTTTWTPPPSCSVPYPQGPPSLGYSLAFQAQSCLGDFVLEDATDCWPPASGNALTPTAPFDGRGFYSPGLECPVGYASACTATGAVDSDGPYQFTMLPSETAVGCCPSGFFCSLAGRAQTCTSLAGSLDNIELATCDGTVRAGASYLTLPYALTLPPVTISDSSSTYVSGSSRIYTITDYLVVAPMIEIRWQSSDRASPGAVPATPNASPGSTSSSSSTSSPPPEPTGSGLSTGAKAGIGVAIPVVVIAALIGAFFLWRRKRTRNAADPVPPWTEAQHYQQSDPRHELRGDPVYEMSEQGRPTEMEYKDNVPYQRHEVQGSDPQLAR